MKNRNITLVILIIFAIMFVVATFKFLIVVNLYKNAVKSNISDIEIIDLSYFYNGDKSQRKRNISSICGITIHHTANTDDSSIRDIYEYQKDEFAKIGICYNFIIRKNGTIVKCHEYDELLTHAPNANTTDIAICLVGNFEKEDPTEKQVESVKYLINYLKDRFNIKYVRGHQDVKGNKTLCPGTRLKNKLKEFI